MRFAPASHATSHRQNISMDAKRAFLQIVQKSVLLFLKMTAEKILRLC
jgi:hypothetical protein